MPEHSERRTYTPVSGTRKRVLLVGAYGGANLGDELILHGIASAVRSRGHDVVVASPDRAWTRAAHGLDVVEQFNARRLRLHALRHVRDVDAVVIGGGEQIQESASGSPFWGLLSNVAAWTAAGRVLRTPVVLWAVGVERLATPWGRWMTRRVCGSAAAVTVRDVRSRGRLQALGHEAELVADPVFRSPREDHETSRRRVWELLGGTDTGQPLVLLSLAHDRRVPLHHLGPLLVGCHRATEARGGVTALHLMDRRERYDRGLLSIPDIARLPRIEVGGAEWAADLRKLHAGADVVVSSRMHPLILAASQGTPWVNVARGSKMQSLADMFGRPALDIVDLEAEAVAATIDEALDMGRDAWQWRDDSTLVSLQEAAGRPLEILDGLLAEPGPAQTREAEVRR